MHNQEIDILARTIYGEARGEFHNKSAGISGLIAVGNVVLNRLSRGKRFGQTIKEVCLKEKQFSCWNTDDPNYLIISKEIIKDSVFDICQKVSENLMRHIWPDLTKNSDHYHHVGLDSKPYWTRGHTYQVQIGNHLFYKLA